MEATRVRILRVKNYEKYQNHRAKDPRWIKLYRTLLTDRDFLKLDIDSRYIFVGLLIIASETGNCVVNDTSYLAHRLSIDVSRLNLTPLFRSGLLVASPSTIRRINGSQRREETERETEERESTAQAPPTASVRGCAYPEDFKPNERAESLAAGYGLNVHKLQAAFADHHRANGSIFKDWQAAFRNWIRNEVKFSKRGAHAL